MSLRAETAVWVVAAAMTALLLLAWVLLVPDPPRRTPLPSAADLQRLTAYLRPAEAVALTPGSMTLDGDPFRSRLWGSAGAAADGGGGAEGTGAASPPRWVLSALLIGEGRSMAVINDRLVAEGDAVEGGATVETVAADHVILRGADGRRIRLDLQS